MAKFAQRRSIVPWVLLLAAVGCRRGDGGEGRFEPLTAGRPVPVYAVRTLGADSMRIQPGEPLTLLNIWATWCIPCRQEFPALEALQRRYAPRGLRVLAVSVDGGGDAAVRSFVAEEGATFTIGRDESGEIQRLFQTVGVPETFLIGTDGRLVWRKIGALDSTSQDVIAQIEKALGK